MAPLDLLRNESLNRKEQAAFSELADTLIFETPAHFRLTRKSVPELSRHVQESFKKQDELHEIERNEFIEGEMMRARNQMRDNLEEIMPKAARDIKRDNLPVEKKIDERSVTEKVLTAVELYIIGHGREYWQSQGYGAWGFTPKLAAIRTKDYERPYEKDGKNCFGVVQGLGAFLSNMGLSFEMGITADHPFAVVEIEGKTYLASLFGVHEAKGTFETRDGYKMYAPSPEDKLPYKLMTVWNFDEALVYELLENFEVLRQMSLGNEVESLPGTEESGMKLAEQHRGVLQGASWRAVQEKVTPRLAAYFREHQAEWEPEVERINMARHINHSFVEIMKAGQSATSLKDASPETFREEFLPIAKDHGQSIVNFIVSDVECDSEVPTDVVLFAQSVKDMLAAIPIAELRVELTRGFLRPFVEKAEKAEALTEE